MNIVLRLCIGLDKGREPNRRHRTIIQDKCYKCYIFIWNIVAVACYNSYDSFSRSANTAAGGGAYLAPGYQ